MIITEDEAKRVLGKYLDTIRKCIQDGWDRYRTMPTKYVVDFSMRSRSSLVHDFIVAAAKKSFFENPVIQCGYRRNLFQIDFGEIILRFKKFNRKLRPHSIPTSQSQSYMVQMIQEHIPGIPVATRVTAGYRLDQLQHDIYDVNIVCFGNNECVWCLELPKVVSRGEVPKIQTGLERKVSTPRARAKEAINNENIGEKKG